jgi:hypothetical protein
MINRKWVIYNTLTGEIIKTLEPTEDNIYLDVNNGDEGTITVPLYSLSNTDRLGWARVFKPWAKGIALLDDDKEWDDPNSIIFAGPIVKRTFDTETETLSITAFSVYEYLKKIPVPPIWTTITDATATETFTAGTWAGVYAKLLERGTDDAGKPTGWNFIKTFSLPSTSGSGFSTTVNVVDQNSVAEVLEELRDEVSLKGNEFRFIPKYTTSSKQFITFQMLVGTETTPHINFDNNITVNLFESNTDPNEWRVKNYNIDDDATLIYNKIVINGSTDSVTANLQASFDVSTDPEMPGLTEKFEAGVDLTTGELSAQLAARIDGSLITDKNISLTIDNDNTLDWLNHIGKKITFQPGIKAAGAKTTARIVSVSFSNNDKNNNIQIDVVKIANRYPKLPRDKQLDVPRGDLDYPTTNIPVAPETPYGDGGTGWEQEGDVYIAPPEFPEPEEPEVSDPNMLYNSTGTTRWRPTSAVNTQWFRHVAISNQTPEGYVYDVHMGRADTTYASFYTNSTDVVSDISINIGQLEVNETTYIEPFINRTDIGTYTLSGAALTTLMALPATTTYNLFVPSTGVFSTTGTTTPNTLTTATQERFFVNLWTVKDKLFVLLTKKRTYRSTKSSQNATVAILHSQALIRLDIDPATGLLSNETVITDKFAPEPFKSDPEIFLMPHNEGYNSVFTPYGVSNGIFQISNDEIIFMKLRRMVNFYNAISTSTTTTTTRRDDSKFSTVMLGTLNALVEPVLVNYATSTTNPTYLETEITPPTPVGEDTGTITIFDGSVSVSGIVKGYKFYEYSSDHIPSGIIGSAENCQTYYTFNPETKTIYCVIAGNLASGLYDDVNSVIDEKLKKVWKLKYGETSTFSEITNTAYTDGEYVSTSTGDGNKLLDTSVPVNNNINTFIPIDIDGKVYLSPELERMTPFSTYNTMLAKEGSFLFERTNSVSNSTGMNAFFQEYESSLSPYQKQAPQFYMKSSNDETLVLSNTLTFQRRPSPYKYSGKECSYQTIADTTGKLWVYGNAETGEGKSYAETNIPLQTSLANKFVKIAKNFTSGTAFLGIDDEGKLWAMGSNANYLTGLGTNVGTTQTLTQVGTKTWTDVIIGSNGTSPFAAAIDTDGHLFTWGANSGGQTARGLTTGTTNTPTQIGTAKYKAISGCRGLIVIDENDKMWYSGTITGLTAVSTLTAVGTKDWQSVSVGHSHSLAIDTDNKLFALGSNANGRTGQNTTTGTLTDWTAVGTTLNYKSVDASETSVGGASIGVTTGGELYEWGSDVLTGVTGTGNTLTPTKVGTLSNWEKVFRGFNALKTDGTLWNATGTGSEPWSGTWTTDWRQIFGGEEQN